MDLSTTSTVMSGFLKSANDFSRKIHWPTLSTAENVSWGAKIALEVLALVLHAQMASVWCQVLSASPAWKIVMSVQMAPTPVGSAPMDFSLWVVKIGAKRSS